MTNKEFTTVSNMLRELEKKILDIFRDKAIELVEMRKEDCTECEKSHDPNITCLEAGAVRLNV